MLCRTTKWEPLQCTCIIYSLIQIFWCCCLHIIVLFWYVYVHILPFTSINVCIIPLLIYIVHICWFRPVHVVVIFHHWWPSVCMILLHTSMKLPYFIMWCVVPYYRLLHACLLHARLLNDCWSQWPLFNFNITTWAYKWTLCRSKHLIMINNPT